MRAHEGLEGPNGAMPAVYAMEAAYATYTDALADRLRKGCDTIDATAQALRDILTVYRRADGQA
ncbi:hypothetical protein [Actinocrispum wychmicini]|uniref:Uncharacterized protein n=1 Tax=Actinocrispum wychmicini TaxID=1213861 RepID=A0A4R2IUR7_9PSEU|nr:hypothetical protein [Actinocrispum wychmicini]TCO48069.1 hypothetical protein EV192_116122 [Actinocrispum wychmicini]